MYDLNANIYRTSQRIHIMLTQLVSLFEKDDLSCSNKICLICTYNKPVAEQNLFYFLNRVYFVTVKQSKIFYYIFYLSAYASL